MPDAFELLKARINFDLTGKSAEKRIGYGALGVSVGSVIIAYRLGGTSDDFVIAAVIWLALMAILGIGFVVTRKRNAKFAARLQAAGFAPVTDETGRVRYLPPGGRMPGHGNPFGAGPYGPYGAQAQGAPAAPQQPAPGHPQQPRGTDSRSRSSSPPPATPSSLPRTASPAPTAASSPAPTPSPAPTASRRRRPAPTEPRRSRRPALTGSPRSTDPSRRRR